jgi:hypothetical protein
MKRIIFFAMSVIIIYTAQVGNPVSAQIVDKTGENQKPIPDDVMKIAKKACISCHAEPGNMMALSTLDLSKWDGYTLKKQAAKGKAMCEMITKDKMPPAKFKKNNPDAVLTQEDIKTICDWAVSLKIPDK